jgi:MYXO-CTERM domain-containing protein
VGFETTAESTEGWVQFIFPWTDFARAEWADEGGLAELDPGRITGYAFSLGAGEERREGSMWVDDVGLAGGEEPPSAPAESPTAVPAAAPTAEPAASEEPGEEEKPGGGLCPFAPVALPLGALGILLARRRRA